jgi:phytoene synthase
MPPTNAEEHEPFVPLPLGSREHAAVEHSASAGMSATDIVADIAACKSILALGSKSFAAASLLLPRRMRDPAAVFYAFCRIADDLVDLSPEPAAAVEQLNARLDRIYANTPDPDPVDRAFARVVAAHQLPRTIVDALIEGFAWDAQGREYETLSDVLAYCARVASAVGVVMTLLMGSREPHTLARACDLGAAMQLTNIARDVAEDAGRGRLYLPCEWLRAQELEPATVIAELARTPVRADPRLAEVVRALLDEADRYYRRADAGIRVLPRDCRPAIRAASLIYADIGRVLRTMNCDPARGRAYTSKARKLGRLIQAWTRRTPGADPGALAAPAIPECAFLVEAVAPGESA